MEQNNYQVPIEALPRNIQAIVQRCIQGSGQDVQLIDQLRQDCHNNLVKRTHTSQPEKQRAHPYKSIKEAVAHA